MRKYWISLAFTGAALTAAPIIADDYVKPGCAELSVSALAEPEWYAEECLSGVAPDARISHGQRVPGDLSYINNLRAGAPGRGLYTAPLPTLTYTFIGVPAPTSIFAMAFDTTATTLWGIDSVCVVTCTGRDYGTINQTTGAFTVVGQITGPAVGANFSGMRFDPTTGTVYISAIVATGTQIWTLNLTNGVATLVGPTTGSLIDISFSNTGQLFGLDIATDNLVSINKATGAGTLVGPIGFNANFAQGMDFDLSTNILYLYLYLGGGANRLATVNLTTGAATVVATSTNEENEGAIKVALATLTPVSLSVDAAPGNGVMQPGESVIVAPTWRNVTASAVPATGTLSNFAGPAGGTYTINDSAASYGTIAAGGTASCGSNCYSVTASAATRPVQHWDSTVLETTNPAQTKTWTLHIGDSFTDVPRSNGFYRFIETLFHRGVTGGCGGTNYCPSNPTARDQMAVFVLIAKEGPAYSPVACGATPMFADVPTTSPFCRFIEELARRGVVSGCGNGNYCPSSAVTRDTMAVFALRTLDPAINPPACTTPMFNDVPASNGFCRWIEELARRGIVSGCGNGNYCPTDPVTREQMGVFLTQTFSLTLYGV